MEQFIESIFPSQKPPVDEKKTPVSAEEAARLKQEEEQARWETIYMVLAVVGTIVFITGLMVSASPAFSFLTANIAPVGCCLAGGSSIRSRHCASQGAVRTALGHERAEQYQRCSGHQAVTRPRRTIAVTCWWTNVFMSICISNTWRIFSWGRYVYCLSANLMFSSLVLSHLVPNHFATRDALARMSNCNPASQWLWLCRFRSAYIKTHPAR